MPNRTWERQMKIDGKILGRAQISLFEYSIQSHLEPGAGAASDVCAPFCVQAWVRMSIWCGERDEEKWQI